MGFHGAIGEIDSTLLNFVDAERAGDATGVQRGYEQLFWLCYLNHLNLTEILHDADQVLSAESHQAETHHYAYH